MSGELGFLRLFFVLKLKDRFAVVLACVVTIGVPGCLGSAGLPFEELVWPPPSARVSSSLVDELPSGEHVFELESRDLEIFATGRSGIYRSVDGGGFEPWVRFESDETMFPARRLPDGRIVGQGKDSGEIRVFSASGRREEFSWDGKVHKRFRLGSVTGGGEPEILLIPRGQAKALAVWSLAGDGITAISSEFFITDFGAADFDGDGVGEIVLYEYPVAKGRGAFRVLRPTGEIICQWELPELIGSFTILRWPGLDGPVIMSNPGDYYLVTRMCGEPVARLEAPNASWFRSMTALWFGGDRWLAIASAGSGYRPFYRLSIFTVDGEPVHHEAGEGRAYALAEDSRGFLLGVRNRIIRYDAASSER